MRSCSIARFIPKDALEEIFEQHLQGVALSPDQARTLKGIVQEVAKEGKVLAQRHNATIKRQINDLEAERQRVFDLHRQGIYSDTEFLEQRRILTERIQQTSLLLGQETGWDGKRDSVLDYVLSILQNPANTWTTLQDNYPARIIFQRRLIPFGTHFDGRRLRTSSFGLMYQLKGVLQKDKCDMVNYITRCWNDLMQELDKWDDLYRSISH